MAITRWVFDLGRLMLMLTVIAQAVIFSAHVARVHNDPCYYANTLIALPSLTVSWWYFARPPSDRVDRPTFVWLAYALTVVAFQVLVFGGTTETTHDSTLLHIANVFTPALFFLCIVTGCERCLKDAEFVIASGVVILNAFDVTDALVAISRNGWNISASLRGGFAGVACVLLVWSALEFTVRSKMTDNRVLPVTVANGLHAVHLALNTVMFALRVVLYAAGSIEFSSMIAKNVMVFIVRFVYMLSVLWIPSRSWSQPPSSPSAPPPPPSASPPPPSSPQPLRSALRQVDRDEVLLYPALPKHVQFFEDNVDDK